MANIRARALAKLGKTVTEAPVIEEAAKKAEFNINGFKKFSGKGQNYEKYMENKKPLSIDDIKTAAGMKPKNVNQYIYQKAANKGVGYTDMLGNEANHSRVAKGIGMEEKAFAALDQEGKSGAIADWVKTEKNRDPNLIDKAGYHKVPQKLLGAAVLGGTVLAMSGSRGHQSNAQLYGQQQQY